MAHIFISHSSEDVEFARYLRALLENEGFSTWMDESRLSPGDDWWDLIEQNIDTCAAFIVIMSPGARRSRWVKRELLRAEQQKRPIYPVLFAGEPWSRLADIQFEDMRAGLRAQLSSHFIGRLQARFRSSKAVELRLVQGDITDFKADVVALKYAQGFYGADHAMTSHLSKVGYRARDLTSAQGEYRFVETRGVIPASSVLFAGVVWLGDFGYQEIRHFAARVLQILAAEAPDTRHLAMTIHGVNSFAGLDETEALHAQLNGYVDVIQRGEFPRSLEQITIVEFAERRLERLRAILQDYFAAVEYGTNIAEDIYHLFVPEKASAGPAPLPGEDADVKPYVLAILPDRDRYEDVFYYGIQGAAHVNGLLCEQIEMFDAVDAESLEQVRQRIENAIVVVAEVTEASPHVYLQIGYAWGKNRPTILLTQNGTTPLPGPSLVYDKISDLEAALARILCDHCD